MDNITMLQAFLIAFWVGIVQSRCLGYSTLTLRFSPMMTGLVVGIVLNNVGDAMIITAGIQLIYMGAIAPGGAMPSEPAVATALAVPVALVSIANGMSVEAAIGVAIPIAVPIGMLGSYLYSFRFFLNTMLTSMQDKYAASTNDKGLFASIIGIPILISWALYIPLIFVALYYGAPVIADIAKSLEGGQLFHVLTVVGGGLAALGIALIIHVIGKKSLLVFFFLAYFMSVSLSSLGINTVTYAIFGSIAAVLYILFSKDTNEGGQSS